MAACIFTIAIIYQLLILYSRKRLLWKHSLIVQFFFSWLIVELAWSHIIVSAGTIIMAIGDINDWTFTTVVGIALSAYNIVQLWQMHKQGNEAEHTVTKALEETLGADYRNGIVPPRRKLIDYGHSNAQWFRPFSFASDNMIACEDITYGPHENNTLNIFKPADAGDKPAPVMLQIHGGGWILGHSEKQGLPLRNRLVEAGWIFVSINYRLSPAHKFPAHLVDCKQALVWIKQNIADYGGDPNFIMCTGGSAGGHLCSLLALTENQHIEILQPGFEDAETSVQGCIPMYGVYDFKDRNDLRFGMPITEFLENYVMPYKLEFDDGLWDIASPIAQVHEHRPSFFVLHGENDTLSFCEDARYFVEAMRESSQMPCAYAELEHAQHAFDIFYSPRCNHVITAMHSFAEYCYSQYLDTKKKK